MPTKTEREPLTDEHLETLLSLGRSGMNKRLPHLSRDELVRVRRMMTQRLSGPGAGTAAQSKINLDNLEDAEKRDAFVLDPTRPQSGPPKEESIFSKIIGSVPENRGLLGLSGKASGAVTNTLTEFADMMSGGGLEAFRGFNLNIGGRGTGPGGIPTGGPGARQQAKDTLDSISNGAVFAAKMMYPATEEAGMAGELIVNLGDLIGESYWKTLVDPPGTQPDWEVALNTLDVATLGALSVFTKSRRIAKTLDEAVELGVKVTGPGETVAALDSVADSVLETRHLARNAGNKEAVERLKGLLAKIEKSKTKVRKTPEKITPVKTISDVDKSKNLKANAPAVIGTGLPNTDIPLGLRRKPIIDANLESLSDEAFDLKESTVTKKIDDIEKQFDDIITDSDGREELYGKALPDDFYENMARAQDEFDAVEREALRRQARYEDPEGIAYLLRNLSLRTDSGKADLIAIMRGVEASGDSKDVEAAIKKMAAMSPDHAEIMSAVVKNIRKVRKELELSVGSKTGPEVDTYVKMITEKNPQAGATKTALIVNMASGVAGAGLANYLYNEPGKDPFQFLGHTIIGGLGGLVIGNVFTSPNARAKLMAIISVPGTEFPKSGASIIDALVPNKYIGHEAGEAFGRKALLATGAGSGAALGAFMGRDEGEPLSLIGAGLGLVGGGVVGSGAGQFLNLKRLFKGGFNPNLAAKKLLSRSGGMDPAFIANREKLIVEQAAITGRIKDALAPVLKAVDKDPEVGNILSAVARGLKRDTSKIPQKVLDANNEIRGLFDELGRHLIRVGLAQGRAAEAIVDNIGTYLPRLYMAHERADAVNTMVRYLDRNGIQRSRLGDLAGLKKRKDLTALERNALEEITEEFGRGNPGLLGLKRLYPTAADIYVADNARFIASSPGMSIPIGTSKKTGTRLDETKLIFKEGNVEVREWQGRRYTKMGDSRNLADIKGRWVEELIAQDMHTMVELPSAFRQVIDMGTGFFKAAKVVWNHATLFRNNISNYLQADAFGGLSMANLNVYSQTFADYFANAEGHVGKAIKRLAEKGGLKDVAGAGLGAAGGALVGDDIDPLNILAGAVGGAVAGRGVEKARVFLGGKAVVGRPGRYKMWRDNGLFVGNWFPTEVEQFLPEIFKRNYIGNEKTVAGIFAKLRQYTLDQGSKWHQGSEEFSKMAMANYAHDSLGKPVAEAVEYAKKYIYDYQDVPRIIEWARKSPVGAPFITFSYKTIPRVAESAISFGSLADLGKIPGQLIKGQLGAAAGSAFNNKFIRFWKWPAAIGAMNEYTAHLFGLKEGENPTTPLGAAARFGADALARPFAKLRDVVMDGIGIGDVTGLKEHMKPWKGGFQVFFPRKDQFDAVTATDLTWNLPWGDLAELNQDRFGPSSPWWQTGVAMTTGLYELTQQPVITPEATAAQAALDANEFIWKQWGPTWAGFGADKVRKAFQGPPSEDNPDTLAPSTAIAQFIGVPKTERVVPGASLKSVGFKVRERVKALDRQKKKVLKSIASTSEKELAQEYVQSEIAKDDEFMLFKEEDAQARIKSRSLDVKDSDLSKRLLSKAKKLLEITKKQMRIQIEQAEKFMEAESRFPKDVFFPEKLKEGKRPKDKGSEADKARETLEFLRGERR